MKQLALVALVVVAACVDAPDLAQREAEVLAVAPPTSTITVTVDDGNPTSQHPYTPSTTVRCDIPKGVLDDLPIHDGEPKWKNCTVEAIMVGNPPRQVGYELHCSDFTRPATGHELSCSVGMTLLPPRITGGGSITYPPAPPQRPDSVTLPIDLDTCLAYIERALGICGKTGVAASEPAP